MTSQLQNYGEMMSDDCQPATGRYIRPDGWDRGGYLTESNWDGAAFRLASSTYTDMSYAVRVIVTGRTVQRDQGFSSVRVRIEFVGDGYPSTFSGGWMSLKE